MEITTNSLLGRAPVALTSVVSNSCAGSFAPYHGYSALPVRIRDPCDLSRNESGHGSWNSYDHFRYAIRKNSYDTIASFWCTENSTEFIKASCLFWLSVSLYYLLTRQDQHFGNLISSSVLFRLETSPRTNQDSIMTYSYSIFLQGFFNND